MHPKKLRLSLRFHFQFGFPACKKHSLSANELYLSKNIVHLLTSCFFSVVTQASVFVYKKAEYSLFANKLYFLEVPQAIVFVYKKNGPVKGWGGLS